MSNVHVKHSFRISLSIPVIRVFVTQIGLMETHDNFAFIRVNPSMNCGKANFSYAS